MQEKNNTKNTENRDSNKVNILIVLALLILIVVVIGIAVTSFFFTTKNQKHNTINSGNISLQYTEDTNGITITDAMPMTDATGKKLSGVGEYFDFSILSTISGNAKIDYEVSAEKVGDCTLTNDEVRLYLGQEKDGIYESIMEPKAFTPISEKTSAGTPEGAMLLDSGSFTGNDDVHYRLRMWVAEDTEISELSRRFAVQVLVNAKIET